MNTETRIARCRRRAVVPSLRAVVSQRCAISNLRPHITCELAWKTRETEVGIAESDHSSGKRPPATLIATFGCLATRARFC